eukprot:5728136-Prymnesium_polylepis.1
MCIRDSGCTALHAACRAGDGACVALLLRLSRDGEVGRRSARGATALSIVAKQGHDDLARALRHRHRAPLEPRALHTWLSKGQ